MAKMRGLEIKLHASCVSYCYLTIRPLATWGHISKMCIQMTMPWCLEPRNKVAKRVWKALNLARKLPSWQHCVCVSARASPSPSLPPSYVCHWLASGVDPQLERNEVCSWLALAVHSRAIVKMMFVVTARAVHAGQAGEIYIVYIVSFSISISWMFISRYRYNNDISFSPSWKYWTQVTILHGIVSRKPNSTDFHVDVMTLMNSYGGVDNILQLWLIEDTKSCMTASLLIWRQDIKEAGFVKWVRKLDS